MSDRAIFSNDLIVNHAQSGAVLNKKSEAQNFGSDPTLPAFITKAASKQTYYTIRLLADRGRVLNAYRAYAYFRWVDDWLDEELSERDERIAFIERQQALIDWGYQGGRLPNLSAEERMLLDLIDSDQERDSGLRAYMQNMMAVMAFDAQRRWRLISQQELDQLFTASRSRP